MERKKKFKKKSRHSYEKNRSFNSEGDVLRVKTPRGIEVIGVVETRLGMGKSSIKCADGKVRLCRVPGAKKRRLWVRPGDVVLIEPWEFEGDKKGNIVYKYKPMEIIWLKNHGYFKEEEIIEEF